MKLRYELCGYIVIEALGNIQSCDCLCVVQHLSVSESIGFICVNRIDDKNHGRMYYIKGM